MINPKDSQQGHAFLQEINFQDPSKCVYGEPEYEKASIQLNSQAPKYDSYNQNQRTCSIDEDDINNNNNNNNNDLRANQQEFPLYDATFKYDEQSILPYPEQQSRIPEAYQYSLKDAPDYLNNNNNIINPNNPLKNQCTQTAIPTEDTLASKNADSDHSQEDENKRSAFELNSKSGLEKLKRLVKKYNHDWKKVSKKIGDPKLTPQILREQFNRYTKKPDNVNPNFTHSDDLIICKYSKVYHLDWVKVSEHLLGKTESMIKNRYYAYIRKNGLLDDYLRESQQQEEQKQYF